MMDDALGTALKFPWFHKPLFPVAQIKKGRLQTRKPCWIRTSALWGTFERQHISRIFSIFQEEGFIQAARQVLAGGINE